MEDYPAISELFLLLLDYLLYLLSLSWDTFFCYGVGLMLST